MSQVPTTAQITRAPADTRRVVRTRAPRASFLPASGSPVTTTAPLGVVDASIRYSPTLSRLVTGAAPGR